MVSVCAVCIYVCVWGGGSGANVYTYYVLFPWDKCILRTFTLKKRQIIRALYFLVSLIVSVLKLFFSCVNLGRVFFFYPHKQPTNTILAQCKALHFCVKFT